MCWTPVSQGSYGRLLKSWFEHLLILHINPKPPNVPLQQKNHSPCQEKEQEFSKACRELVLSIYITSTNDKAHRGLLDANPVSKKASLKTNQK